jgi:hypothetical protein
MKKFLFCLAMMGQVAASAQEKEPMMQSTKDLLNLNTEGMRGQSVSANASRMIYGIPRTPGQLIGDNYLDTTFTETKVMLFNEDRIYAGTPGRLDIKNNLLEINTNLGPRVVDGVRIKFFTMIRPPKFNSDNTSSVFVNTRNFKGDGEKINGFLEIITEGRLTLMIHHKAWLKKATYNEALSLGEVNDIVIKERTFYVSRGDMLTKLSVNRKGILEATSDKRSEMEKYLKENDFEYKNIKDLTQIIAHYNKLNESVK